MKATLIAFGSIFFIALLVFYPTFQLAFFGDDWLIFWIDKYFHGQFAVGQWNYLNHFLTRYGSQAVVLGLIKLAFGLQPIYFYVISFLLRMFMAFSIYPVALYLTKNKPAAIFSVLLLSVITTGLESTEYLPHMTSYISLGFFNLFLYFFLRSREITKAVWLILTGVFFYLTFVSAPIRMTGLFAFIIAIELFFLLQNKNMETLKIVGVRGLTLVVTFLVIITTGRPFFYAYAPDIPLTSNQVIVSQSIEGLRSILAAVQQGRFETLFHPLISFGNMLFPSYLTPKFQSTIISARPTTVIAVYFVVFSFIISSFIKALSNNTQALVKIWLPSFIWSVTLALLYLTTKGVFPIMNYLFPLCLAGYSIILGANLLSLYRKNNLISTAVFVSLSWALLAYIVPWFWSPSTIFPTTQRYLIGSSIGISLFLSTILALSFNFKRKAGRIIVACVLLGIVFINVSATSQYISILLQRHNQEDSQKIWSAIPYIPKIKDSDELVVFYFQSDPDNAGTLHDVITYGLGPHIDILYNLNNPTGKNMPIPVDGWENLASINKDGASLAAYGYPIKAVPVENIYGFHLVGKNNLVDITDEVRKKLLITNPLQSTTKILKE